jgi:hypothetical protein
MPVVAFCFLMVLILLAVTAVFLWRDKTNLGPWD